MQLIFFVLSLLVAVISPGALAQEEPLGRLFFTPAQRMALERQRQHGQSIASSQSAMESRQTFNGEVRRSDGRSVRWINGEVNWDKSEIAPRIAVGDTLNRSNGEHQSLIGNGQIIIRPASHK